MCLLFCLWNTCSQTRLAWWDLRTWSTSPHEQKRHGLYELWWHNYFFFKHLYILMCLYCIQTYLFWRFLLVVVALKVLDHVASNDLGQELSRFSGGTFYAEPCLGTSIQQQPKFSACNLSIKKPVTYLIRLYLCATLVGLLGYLVLTDDHK